MNNVVSGFGFPITDEEMETINHHPLRAGKSLFRPCERTPTGSPGLIFFKHGSSVGREGWWDCALFINQVKYLVDCFEVLYPERQFVVEEDWSSGHSKKREDGLDVNRMNVGPGGSKPTMHDTVICSSACLGSGDTRTLNVGDMQSLVFPDNYVHPSTSTTTEKKRKKQKVSTPEADPETELPARLT